MPGQNQKLVEMKALLVYNREQTRRLVKYAPGTRAYFTYHNIGSAKCQFYITA